MDGGTPSLAGLAAQTAWLRRLARSLVWDTAAADDLVQDTFVVAAEHAPRDGRPLGPWLVRVLRNLHRMRGRSASRRAGHAGAIAAQAPAPPTPAELVDQVEVHRMLAGLVLELPPAARDVVLLHYVEGLASGAIAQRLGIPAGTVRWRHQQALAELRARLDQRRPSRAWMPALAALAGPRPASGFGLGALIAAAIALVVLAGWLIAQLHADPVSIPAAAETLRRSPSSPELAPRPALDGDGHRSLAAVVVRLPSGLVRVEGHVVDDHRAPVEGADVAYACSWNEDAVVDHVRSGAGGAFAVVIEHDCLLDLTARKDARVGRGMWSLAQHTPVEVQLAPTLIATVRVVDTETGAPIAGATVAAFELSGPTTHLTALADGAGIARIAVPIPSPTFRSPISSVHVRALATGYLRGEVVIRDDPRPAPLVLTIRLWRGIAIRGRIVDPDGAPVADADIDIDVGGADRGLGPSIRPLGAEHERGDAEGRFVVAVFQPGRYRVVPSTAQLIGDLAQTTITVGADGRDDVVIRLDRRADVGIAGVVLGPDGAPVAGARVLSPRAGTAAMRSDAQGRFASSDPRSVYRLVARAGDLSSEVQIFERGAAKLLQVTLTLGPSGIAGVAVDRDGFVVPGAEVYLNPAHASMVFGQRTVADRDGRFAFDTPRGSFVLSVRRTSDDDFLDDDDVRVDAGTHDLRLIVP